MVLGAGLGLVLAAAGAGAAGADADGVGHAKVVGSTPADGTIVRELPDRVVLDVDAKPATVEGDPLRVYAPDGRRVDQGPPEVDDAGHHLSVALDRSRGWAAGDYHVVYRIVSADTHLIAGSLAFHVLMPGGGALALVGDRTAGGDARPLLPGGPDEPWPVPLAAGAAVLGLLAIGRPAGAQPPYRVAAWAADDLTPRRAGHHRLGPAAAEEPLNWAPRTLTGRPRRHGRGGHR